MVLLALPVARLRAGAAGARPDGEGGLDGQGRRAHVRPHRPRRRPDRAAARDALSLEPRPEPAAGAGERLRPQLQAVAPGGAARAGPNGLSGWVSEDHVQLRATPWRIVVNTSSRVASVYRSGRLARRFGVVVGAPGTTTPEGLFAVAERQKQPNPNGFVGPWVLALTARSSTLENYAGGPGVTALHGRGGSQPARPARHGALPRLRPHGQREHHVAGPRRRARDAGPDLRLARWPGARRRVSATPGALPVLRCGAGAGLAALEALDAPAARHAAIDARVHGMALGADVERAGRRASSGSRARRRRSSR